MSRRTILVTIALLPLLLSATPEEESLRVSDEEMAALPAAEVRGEPRQQERLDLPPGVPAPDAVDFDIIEEPSFRGSGCGRATLPDVFGATTVSPIGWTFPYLYAGDCPISASMLLYPDHPSVFGSVNF